MAQLFEGMPSLQKTQVLQMHSRMSQSQRNNTSNQFRQEDGRNKIMFSSDVSARGMDYPDVTHVVQVGLTTREQYIHRLGRTARAGKSGEGWLLLAPFEEKPLVQKELKGMSVTRIEMSPARLQPVLEAAQSRINQVDVEMNDLAAKAYGAWLGFYNGALRKLNWDKRQLVQEANAYAKHIGLRATPALEKKTIGKMGLKGTP